MNKLFAGEKVGDLVKDKSIDVFCHQCNCYACMGGGIAYQIADTYPEVPRHDGEYFDEVATKYGTSLYMLGTILPVKVKDNRICVNMYAQYAMGISLPDTYEDPDTESRRLGYFKDCLYKLKLYLDNSDNIKTVGFPKFIGCGLAGGDWDLYRAAILGFAETVRQEVYIVSLK